MTLFCSVICSEWWENHDLCSKRQQNHDSQIIQNCSQYLCFPAGVRGGAARSRSQGLVGLQRRGGSSGVGTAPPALRRHPSGRRLPQPTRPHRETHHVETRRHTGENWYETQTPAASACCVPIGLLSLICVLPEVWLVGPLDCTDGSLFCASLSVCVCFCDYKVWKSKSVWAWWWDLKGSLHVPLQESLWPSLWPWLLLRPCPACISPTPNPLISLWVKSLKSRYDDEWHTSDESVAAGSVIIILVTKSFIMYIIMHHISI